MFFNKVIQHGSLGQLSTKDNSSYIEVFFNMILIYLLSLKMSFSFFKGHYSAVMTVFYIRGLNYSEETNIGKLYREH